jgi:hypothetical protein
MKLWIIATFVIAAVVVASLVVGVANASNTSNGVTAQTQCTACGQQCSQSVNCGLESCGAKTGGTCNCGK